MIPLQEFHGFVVKVNGTFSFVIFFCLIFGHVVTCHLIKFSYYFQKAFQFILLGVRGIQSHFSHLTMFCLLLFKIKNGNSSSHPWPPIPPTSAWRNWEVGAYKLGILETSWYSGGGEQGKNPLNKNQLKA